MAPCGRPDRRRSPQNRRSAFTLLEVVLSLSIGLIVLAAVALAIDLHLRVVDRGRTEVEQAQLARAVLRRMADDLRSAVRYEPIDFDSLVPSVGIPSDLGGGGGEGEEDDEGGGDDAGGGTDGGADADAAAADAEGATSDAAQSVADSAQPETVPGLYGNEYEMQIDVSRLPRIEDFGQYVSADGASRDHPSDVKTVAYYVRAPANAIAGSAVVSSQGGLVRRELARAAALFAYENGGLAATEEDVEPFAPEVTAVGFRYFDGTEFFPYWDSTERQGLPLAVEITIEIAPPADESVEDEGAAGAAEEPVFLVYQLLVHLPAAEATDEEAMAAAEEEEESDDEASQDSQSQGDAQGGQSGQGGNAAGGQGGGAQGGAGGAGT